MYNIIQLNDKDLSELQSIAKELDIKNTDSLRKEDLVYKILDEQAIVGATKKVAAAKANEGQPRKRSRIAKKDGDKVYTATQDKAKKLEANDPQPAEAEVKSVETTPQQPAEAPAAEAATAENAPKKRGRKPGSKNKATIAAEEAAKAAEENKEKADQPAEAPAEEKEAKQAIPEMSHATDDFIPIEDLPSEKVELPSELFGKFEATKVEAPAVAPVQGKFQQHQPRERFNNQ